MNIQFRRINCFTAKPGVHSSSVNAVVVEFYRYIDLVAMDLSSNGFEEG